MKKVQLVPEQLSARDKCREALKRPGSKMVLSGSAGTGKTTTARAIVDVVAKDMGCRPSKKFGLNGFQGPADVMMCAPTHQAANVLFDKTQIQTKTIHSALFIKGKQGEGTIEFERDETKATKYRLPRFVVCDEASMISEEMLAYIDEDIARFGDRYLFIGDEKQINPVGYDYSPVMEMACPIVKLEQIHRQAAANDNIYLSNNLELLTERMPEEFTDGKFYKRVEAPRAKSFILEGLSRGFDVRYIGWRNASVNAVNEIIRREHVRSSERVAVGERIMFTYPYTDLQDNFYHVTQEIKVFSAELTRGKGTNPIEYYLVNDSVLVPTHDGQERLEQRLQHLVDEAHASQGYERKAAWGAFFTLKDRYASITYPYAITVHRAQGSTFDHSVVDVGDILANDNLAEVDRLLYTGLTRTASHNLLIL